MDMFWRSKRNAELLDLRFTNPIRLVRLYRALAGLDDSEPLPTSASYTSIIEEILEYEEFGQEAKQLAKANPDRPTFTLNDPTITLIEHLRSSPVARAGRHKPSAPEDVPIAKEVFGPINIYDEGIDWLAAARFAPGSVR